MSTRGCVVQVRVTREEQRAAQRVARSRGTSVAETIRQLLKDAHDRIGTQRGDAPSGTAREA